MFCDVFACHLYYDYYVTAHKCVCGALIHPKDKHSICLACRLRPAPLGTKLKYHCQTHSDGSQSLGLKCAICKVVPIKMFKTWTDCKLHLKY